MVVRISLLVIALIALGVTTVFAAKPSDPDHNVVRMSNGYPSGPHFNFNVHGKKPNFLCPAEPYGASAFIPEYSDDFPGIDTTITYVASKKHDVSVLTIHDACSEAFDTGEIVLDGDGNVIATGPSNDNPIRVQLPKMGDYKDGFWVFGRVLAKPKNRDGETSNIILEPDPQIKVCNDGTVDFDGDGTLDDCPTPDSDLMPLGLITSEGVYVLDKKTLRRVDEGPDPKPRGKGKVRATDITNLFTWTGYVCDEALDTDGDGDIDEDDVLADLDGDGNVGNDPDDLAIYLATFCDFKQNEWVFNVGDLVAQDVDIKNNGAKLLKIRFYPVSTTEFTPTKPLVTTEIHKGTGVGGDDPIVITGQTVSPPVIVHDKAILTVGTGPAPKGSVTFTFYANGTCAVDGTVGSDNVTLIQTTLPEPDGRAVGVAHPSDDREILTAGAYSFKAAYDGDDPNYEPAEGRCEPLAVGLFPDVATVIHDDDPDHAVLPTILSGIPTVARLKAVHDSVTVKDSGPVPTGQVTFFWFTNRSDCAPLAAATSAALNLNVGLSEATLDATTFTRTVTGAGAYAFRALYHGDENYLPKLSPCEPLRAVEIKEPLNVEPASNVADGVGAITVTATVWDGTSEVAGVRVFFEVTDGPNTGVTGSDFTDVNGEATFIYSSTEVGKDTISVCVDIDFDIGSCDTLDISDIFADWTTPA